MHPIHPIRENGEESDMEEQMPELVDISDNEISSTRENLQGTTTENQSVRITFKMKIQKMLLQTHKYS